MMSCKAGRAKTVRLLIDTHAFLWWAAGNQRLPEGARDAIASEDNEVLLSAASVWEIATKVRLGKLPSPGDVVALMKQGQIEGLPITLDHAGAAGRLPGPHKDPFDRMLVAQAIADGLQIVSNEVAFDTYGVQRIW
jgi:PIN domain nuclease of toxin-antitoxin system